MKIIAKLQNLRIAPRKTRLAADLIRGKELKAAQAILSFATKRAVEPLQKLLKQAEANAKNNLNLDPDNLFISEIMVNSGPKLKRFRPRAHGQSYEIKKRTSHIVLILDEIKKTKKKVKKAKAKEVKQEIVEEKKTERQAVPKEPRLSWDTAEKPKPQVVRKIFKRQVF